MPFGYNQILPPVTFPPASHHNPRNTPPSRGMEQPTDLLSLVPPQETPKKKKSPSKRNHNHLGAPSTAGSHPGGKKMIGKDKVDGDSDGNASDGDDGSSAQEDEDADDENDDESDEEPAVDSPARSNKKRKYTLSETDKPSVATFILPVSRGNLVDQTSTVNGTSNPSVHPAGRVYKQRTYSMTSINTVQSSVVSSEFDEGVITETDDEPDYPRKKVARQLSTTDDIADFQLPGSTSEGRESESMNKDLIANTDESDEVGGMGDEIDEEEDDEEDDEEDEDDEDDEDDDEDDEDNEDDEDDNISLSVDDIPVLSEEDDEEIDEVEAQELAREFELDGPDFIVDDGSSGLPAESDLSIYDGLLSDEDCLGEPGLPGVDDNLHWTDLSALLGYDSMVNDNLFSVPASRDSLGSHTPPLPPMRSPVMDSEAFQSDGWSEDDEVVDPLLDNPFFEMNDPAVRHMVNNANNQNWDPTWMASEDENIWKAFETGESSEEEDDEEEGDESNVEEKQSDEGTEDDDDFDSDATDLDEDLPLPTPQKDSKLKRLSTPTTKPQILRRDPANKNGPFLGSWIADPDRPICIIDGTKKTVLVPASTKRYSLGSDASYHDMFTLDESDYDPTGFSYGINNSTYAGMGGGPVGYMNATCAPSSVFNPTTDSLDFDDLLKNEYGEANEDSVDEEEQMLSIEDVLTLSESEDEGDNGDQSDNNSTPVARRNSDVTGTVSDAEAMLSRWDYVSVTAFRKRQQQHKQRLSGQVGKNRGALKGKLTVNDTTMTPARRRKVRSTTQKPIPMNSNRKSRKDDTQWSSTLPPLFEAV